MMKVTAHHARLVQEMAGKLLRLAENMRGLQKSAVKAGDQDLAGQLRIMAHDIINDAKELSVMASDIAKGD